MQRVLIILFFIIPSLASAQRMTVKGRVTSPTETGGMPGVNVSIKGTSQGTITNVDGTFALEADPETTLIFSFVGHKTQEIALLGQTDVSIVLEESAKELSEVVVVGYSSVEKRNITGAIQTVSGDKLKSLSVSGFDQALQGQVAGVQVTQSSGTPGGGVAVRIRGSTSISAGNTPLYIIDGIPVETGALSSRGFGGQNDNALSLINPNDIETYNILSDASAKALYGSRASNGVVVITTKRGKNSKAKISFDVQRGVIGPVHKIDLLNASQLVELQREAVQNAGQNPDAFGLIPGVTDAVNTDWQDEVLRTGILQAYQLSVTGGDDNTKYYISGSYRDEEGIQLNNNFQRLSLTMNVDQRLSDKMMLGTNLTLSRSVNNRVKGDNFLDGVYSGALKSLPYHMPFDENGNLIGPSSTLYAGFPNFNPVAQALLPRFQTSTVKVLGNVNVVYQIQPNLSLKAQVSLDYNNVNEDQYESSQTAIGGFLPSVGGQGYGVFTATTLANIDSYVTLTYDKELNSKQKLNAVAGIELYQNSSTGANVQGRLFPSDDFTYIASAGIVDNGFSFREPSHSILSFFAEGRFDHDDSRILATASFRTDGSSNFGENNRFGFFPALSAAWRISQEKFFSSRVVSDLKLRASVGLTGNERIGAFNYLGTWGTATYSGNSGVTPNNVPNPNVKWETTREVNFGVDAGFLGGKIQSTLNLYYNITSDLLLTRPYPFTTGFGGILDNIGEMENKGIELSVTSVNIDRNFRWLTTVNLSRNFNKVLYLADSIPLYRGYTGEGVDGTNIIKEGEPLGSFWGLNYLGVNPATGDAMYEDRNKDGLINNSDGMVIGNAQPSLIGGIKNEFQYKGFDLSIFFTFSLGNKVLNFTKATLVNMGGDIQSNQSIDALRRWQNPGDVTDIPRYELGNTTNNLHSNRLLEDASYLRLKNVSLGYNLPKKITERMMLDNCRVYISATNLWTLTKYTGSDPEVSTLDGSTSAQGIDFFTLPQVMTVAVGINATLK
ncbi:MAG: TonB-dependent receptor [Cyclobacteriaceae bacterium]|nr:TonB-dependent receptor [Cyclobacteriaceae bacterium]